MRATTSLCVVLSSITLTVNAYELSFWGLQTEKPVAACTQCQRLANVTATDQQDFVRLAKACEDANNELGKANQRWEDAEAAKAALPPGADSWQADKALNSAQAGGIRAGEERDQICGRMVAREKIVKADFDALWACNAKCVKAVPDPPKDPPPPKPPAPDPTPPKPAKMVPRTMTHVTTTCGPCRDYADAANKNMDYCSAENDPQNCAAMDKWLKELGACEKKECAPVANSVGAVTKTGSTPGKAVPTSTPQQQQMRAPQVPSKLPAQGATQQIKQPPTQQQNVLKLPPKPPAEQAIRPTSQQQSSQLHTLQLPPKSPTPQGAQPILQQQPNQQGVLKLPPKAPTLPSKDTTKEKAGLVAPPQ